MRPEECHAPLPHYSLPNEYLYHSLTVAAQLQRLVVAVSGGFRVRGQWAVGLLIAQQRSDLWSHLLQLHSVNRQTQGDAQLPVEISQPFRP